MRTTSVNVVRIATKGPGDVSGLRSLIEQGEIDPKSIVAILGKTEGNGGVNDFTREYAVSALPSRLISICHRIVHQQPPSPILSAASTKSSFGVKVNSIQGVRHHDDILPAVLQIRGNAVCGFGFDAQTDQVHPAAFFF